MVARSSPIQIYLHLHPLCLLRAMNNPTPLLISSSLAEPHTPFEASNIPPAPRQERAPAEIRRYPNSSIRPFYTDKINVRGVEI